MAGGRRTAPLRGAARGVAKRADTARRQTRSASRAAQSSAVDPTLPDVYRDLLTEAGVTSSRMTSDDEAARPLKKRRRTGRSPEPVAESSAPREPGPEPKPKPGLKPEPDAKHDSPAITKSPVAQELDEEDDQDIEFEDVAIPEPTVQTIYQSSEDEDGSEEEDLQFEDVDVNAIASKQKEADDGTLRLNLTATQQALGPSKRSRKQPLTKEQKKLRVDIHRMHLLCLLAHVERRNHWCNDPVVHKTLLRLLSAKTIQQLNPPSNITQFGQTESLKRGLKAIEEMYQLKFDITERGLRKALWADDPQDLQNYELPSDIDTCLDKADFRKAAKTMSGSRDVGAMLYCALLRAAGVKARLVCSLQPLSFAAGGPTMPKPRPARPPVPAPSRPIPPREDPPKEPPSTARSSIRSRLGHPNATAYNVPEVSTRPSAGSQQQRTVPTRPQMSLYPVYWTEVLDMGHQKWLPVDVLVTGMSFRPSKLEPPAGDPENTLTYVVAFDEEGVAKDVTRRYAKAYNAKTRRMRVDGPLVPDSVEGAKWWRKAMRRYKVPGLTSDLDQIEDAELRAAEAREPMPRNVADFKHHPIYALERHMRRHDVLAPFAKVVGTVSAGSKGALERIYRRRDVRVAQSADKWFRMGRYVEPGSEPVKVLRKPKPARRKGRWHRGNTPESSDDEDDPVLGPDPAKGTCLYMYEQTEQYVPPPVVAGRVPKNKFGNVEVYVPTMVPAGGVHIKHPRAGHAAHILGVDYAPALQGFEFKGRSGTAVYNGAVVPFHAEEGVRAVLQGFEDLEAQMEQERRSRRALGTWAKWMRTLRIRRRLFEGDDYWGDTELGEVEMPEEEDEVEDEGGEGDGMDEEDDEPRGGGFSLGGEEEEEDEEEGGGFIVDDEEGGGFEPGAFEPGGFEPGGFEPGGFEPGGFEPGGFELGSQEAGGFGDDDDKSKGKGAEPWASNHTMNETMRVAFEGVDGTDEERSQGPGGFEPQVETAKEVRPDVPADNEMVGDEMDDAELDDAASDSTEYLEMDDEGNLLV